MIGRLLTSHGKGISPPYGCRIREDQASSYPLKHGGGIMNQPQVLSQTSAIYLEFLALSLLHRQALVKKSFVLHSPPLWEYLGLRYGSDATFWTTTLGVGLILQPPVSIGLSRNSTRTKPMLIIPAVFLPLSFALLFVVALLSPNVLIMLLAFGNVCWWLFLFLYTLFKLGK